MRKSNVIKKLVTMSIIASMIMHCVPTYASNMDHNPVVSNDNIVCDNEQNDVLLSDFEGITIATSESGSKDILSASIIDAVEEKSSEGVGDDYDEENGDINNNQEKEDRAVYDSAIDEADTGLDLVYGRRLTDQEVWQKKELTSLPVDTVPDINEIPVLPGTRDVYPSSYDLRNNGYVTSAKSQGGTGTCWAHATASIAESYGISHGFRNGNQYMNSNNTDLSELQLSYFLWNAPTDPVGNTSGDKNEITNNSVHWYNKGSTGFSTTWQLAKGCGLANESKLPYGINDYLSVTTIDPSLAFKNTLTLTDSYYINVNDSNSLKDAIMENGGVVYQFNFDAQFMDYDTASYFQPQNMNGSGGGHAVAIIGWDDNYNKNKFNKYNGNTTIKPNNNGAWLAKNSWGTGFGDNGFFWISYENSSRYYDTAYSFLFEQGGRYSRIYNYDGTSSYGQRSVSNGGAAANKYTIKGNQERIAAIGFSTSSINTGYSIQLYKNPSTSNPASGTALLSSPISGTAMYAGYHSVKLSQAVTVSKNDVVSVVITYPSGGGYYFDKTATSTDFRYVNAGASGQSYYKLSSNDNWAEDSSSNSNINKTARIKLYTYDIMGGTYGFVYRLYQLVLGRTGSVEEIVNWKQLIESDTKTAAQVVYGFIFSNEYQNTNPTDSDYVDMLYHTLLNRNPDSGGKAYWLDHLSHGLSKRFVLRGFINSTEFTSLCEDTYGITRGDITLTENRDLNPNVTKFVWNAYKIGLDRNPAISDLNNHTGSILDGTNEPKDIAMMVMFSTEFINKNYTNAEFLTILYRVLLGVEPDAPGYNYNLGLLNSGMTRLNMFNSFASSTAYYDMVSGLGID